MNHALWPADSQMRTSDARASEMTACSVLFWLALGYLPTERAVSGGHYSAEIMSNLIGPQGGRMLVERTVQALKAMWSPAP